jgi:hypothetical protein
MLPLAAGEAAGNEHLLLTHCGRDNTWIAPRAYTLLHKVHCFPTVRYYHFIP